LGVVRFAYRVVGTFAILMAIVVLLSQTQWFRDRLRDVLVQLANDNLKATLSFDAISIDIWNGLTITKPVLFADGTRFFQAERLSLFYELAPLSRRIIAVSSLRIDQPNVSIVRSEQNGSWNISHILIPSTDTATSVPPNFTIVVRSLEINDGSLLVNDMTTPWTDQSIFDPTHIRFSRFYLNASASLSLADYDYAVDVNHLSYYNPDAPFDVQSLRMAVRASAEGLEIPLFQLKARGTSVALQAAAPGLNISDDVDLSRTPIYSSIEADEVVAQHVRYFVPEVDILGTYLLHCNAMFSQKSLRVTNMTLDGNSARLVGSVIVNNIDGSAPLYLDVTLQDSYARYAEVRSALRLVPLPQIDFLRRTTMRALRMRGSPEDSLHFEINAEDAPGAVEGWFTFHFNEELGYNADLAVRNGTLEHVLSDSAYRGSVNGRIVARGSGTEFPGLEATVALDLDASTIANYNIRSLRSQYTVLRTGGIEIDTAILTFPPYRSIGGSSDDDTEHRLSVAGVLNFANINVPTYGLRFTTSALDLRTLGKDSTLPQRLSGRFDVQGTGFHLDSLESSVSARISEFVLNDRAMMPFMMTLQAERLSQLERRLVLIAARKNIRDPFLQVNVEGPYAVTDLVTTSKHGSVALVRMIKRELRHMVRIDPDTVMVDTVLPIMAADIRLRATDMSILNALLGDLRFDGATYLEAHLASQPDGMQLDIDTLHVRELRLHTDSMKVDVANAKLSGRINIEELGGKGRIAALDLIADLDSSMVVQGTQFDHTYARIAIANGSGTVIARTALGHSSVDATIATTFTASETILKVSQLRVIVDTTRKMLWTVNPNSIVTMNRGVAAFDNFTLQRPWAESIILNGWASSDRFRQFTVTVEKFPFSDLGAMLAVDRGNPAALIGGNLTTATAVVNGSWNEPVIELNAKAVGVSYNGEVIGDHTMSLRHSDKLVTGSASIETTALGSTTQTLFLDVRALPFNCAFATIDERLLPGKPIDIQLTANQLSLAAVEPFLPAVERVRGRVQASISVSGMAPNDVDFGGRASFAKSQFVVSSTGLTYSANGAMRLEGEQLMFDTLTLRNVASDLRGGMAFAKGLVKFKGFSVESMDFTLETSGFHVLNRASQSRSPNVYGDLSIATRRKPIHFYGPIDAPRLDGDIVIIGGDVVFPKERSTTKRRLGSFTRHVATDSLSADYDGSVVDYVMGRSRSSRMAEDSIYRLLTEDTDDVVRAPVFTPVAEAVEQVTRRLVGGFADILEYNLNVYFGGRFILTMVLGPTELLVADLELVDPQIPLSVGGTLGSGLVLNGKVRVKPGTSSYKFFRSFDASGILDFSRGEMTNPSLNLLAVFKDSRIVGENRREDFRVEILIRGTKEKPITDFRVFRNDEEVPGDSAKVRGDALSLILVGRTQDDLLQSTGQTSLAAEATTAASAAATQILGDVLGGIGNVKTQVDLGADLNSSRISFSGEVFGGLQYRMSGNVADMSANNTFTLSLPLSLFADADGLRYFMLDFSRTINNQSANVTRQQRDWELKLGMRLP